jgi:hypothetical protein
MELKIGATPEVAHFMQRGSADLQLGCGLHVTCVHELGGYAPAYNYLCDEDASVNETMPFELIRQFTEQRFEQGLNAKNCTELTECAHQNGNSTFSEQDYIQNATNNTSQFKWDAWKYSTIGLGAATIAFGTVAAVFVVKSVRKCIRSRNEIQIELIDDPALTHTLLQN